MREWLKKDPENIFYFITFILVFGLATICFLSIANMFD
jgi:hypothetical protein